MKIGRVSIRVRVKVRVGFMVWVRGHVRGDVRHPIHLGNDFSVFFSLCTPYKKPPKIFCDVRRGLTTRQITRRQPITIDY